MKININWILSILLLFFGIQQTNAQTVYNAGNYKLLLKSGNYYEIVELDTIPITTDKLLIKLKSGLNASQRNNFAISHSLILASETKYNISRYSIVPGKDFPLLLTELSQDESVEDFNLNRLVPELDMPNDSYENIISWELLYNNPGLLWPYTNTEMYDAFNITSGNPLTVVCLMDNGIYMNHEDLNLGPDNYSNIWQNPNEIAGNGKDDDENGKIDDLNGWDFIDKDNNPSHYSTNNTHGTKLAGIIAAKGNNNLGVYGVAGGYSNQGVKLLPIRVAETTLFETALFPDAMAYATSVGAKIVNISYGGRYTWGSLCEEVFREEYEYNGVIFLAAAGNNDEDITGNGTINYPAKYENVIAVGATAANPENAVPTETKWSGTGYTGSAVDPELEISAPGTAFYTDVTTNNSGNLEPQYSFATGSNFSTSRATAFATGMIALIKSTNPCLSNDNIREILRNTADKIGPYTYDSDGHCWELGFGRINALAALQACLPSSAIPAVTGTVTWNSDTYVNQEVTIESGGILTITNCTVSANIRTKFIVKPGGKLIVNNSTITSTCTTPWQGIEVWGNSTQHQWPNSNGQYMQGYVQLNDAVIENAYEALNLWKPGDYAKTGGIVIANNTIFRNNRESVHALLYTNHHPVNGKPMDYQAIFTNCTFSITDTYNPAYQFYKHVDLNQVNGVRFNGCDFSLSPNALGVSDYNQAIASYNSGFKVNAICTSSITPCTEYDPCTFSGFYAAINASNSNELPYTFWVNRANFTANATGIKVNGVKNETILFCNFDLGSNTKDMEACERGASSFGIDMVSSNGFVIEENTFQKMQGAPQGLYTGIRCMDSYTEDDVIYKNTFTGLSYGNYAEGMNRPKKENDLKGLKFECNINQNNAIDFIVAGNSYPQIHSFQGTSSLEAGNTFSANPLAEGNFKNMGTQIINYFYRTNPPIYYTPNYIVPIPNAGLNTCPSNHGGGSGTIEVLTESQKLQKELDYATNLSNFNDVKTLFDNLKDGGNTIELKLEVESSWPQDTWELRTRLLGESPHLSEEVLKAAADKTEVLPESILFEILSANPDELRKEILIEYLENKEQPLPEYMISILKQLAGGITYKTVLMQDMARYESLKTSAATDLIRSNLNDDIIDLQYLRNWYDNLNNLNADYEIVATYLAEKDYNSAQAMFELIPIVRELSGNDLLDYEAYSSLIFLQMQWEQQGIDIHQIDDATVNMLAGIAGNENSRAAMLAQSILEYAKDYHFCHCLAETNETLFKTGQIISTPIENGLTIYATPNPANDWVAFNYTLPVNSTDGILKITDMSGKLVEQFTVSNLQGQKVWDTRQIKKGLYLFTLQVGNASKQGKLVIQ